VTIVNCPQHVFVNGQGQIQAVASDPDGDHLSVAWQATYGTVSNDGSLSTTYTAPGSPHADPDVNPGSDPEHVSVTVSDGKETASASCSFMVVHDQF
jgi:hypothetical protein